jgi:hypothetical protein
MKYLAKSHQIRVLELAEEQYKLAIAVRAKVAISDDPLFDYLEAFSFGRYTLTGEELGLSQEEEEAAWALVHCAIYIVAVQLDTVLSETVPDRFAHSDDSIRSSSWIARLTRNAFSHNPFIPTWLTYPECDNKQCIVPGIISLKTVSLNGKCLDRMDYGGPLALLKLSQFIREEILSEAAG